MLYSLDLKGNDRVGGKSTLGFLSLTSAPYSLQPEVFVSECYYSCAHSKHVELAPVHD